MIQLRSAIEELGRVQLRDDVDYPAWQRDELVRERLDGPIREQLLALAPGAGQKVLVIGAGWPRLATDLARNGAFVTVADHDADRIRAVSELAGETGQLGRVTVQVDDYKARAFEASAFHLIVAWDSLNLYTEQMPLLKKINRELKAGGRLFLRAWVRAARGPSPAVRRTIRSLMPLMSGGDRDALAGHGFLMPSHGALDRVGLLEDVEQLLILERTHAHHLLAVDVADLAVGVRPAMAPWVSRASALDQRVLSGRPDLSRFLAIVAVKEKQLGRVFSVEDSAS